MIVAAIGDTRAECLRLGGVVMDTTAIRDLADSFHVSHVAGQIARARKDRVMKRRDASGDALAARAGWALEPSGGQPARATHSDRELAIRAGWIDC